MARRGPRIQDHIIDYSRKLHQVSSFDEECQRIQNEAEFASVAIDASARSVWNSIRADIPTKKRETKQNIVKQQKHTKMDTELIDSLVKAQKRARKKRQKAHQSSSCHLNNAVGSIDQLPTTAAEMSLNKLTIAAILGAVRAQNHQEESMISECFQKSIHRGKYDKFDEMNMQQVQMTAKAFVDQMFIDRKYMCKDKTSSVSNALEVLNSNKGILVNLLPDPNSLLAKRIKNLRHSEEPGSVSTTQREKTSKNLWKKSNYQCQFSAEASLTAQTSDKIIILKPVSKNRRHSENVTCHCSSQSRVNLSRRVSNAKSTSFSFGEMKKKLKHTFGVTGKELSLFSTVGTSAKLSHDRATLKIGHACICRGVEIRNALSSSIIAKTKGNLCKKQDLKSNRGADIARVPDTERKKLDFSSVRLSNKQEFDVVLEAKRHLSLRLKNVNAADTVTRTKSPKTLRRILSSPEHDFSPHSPRRACLSPLRLNTEVTSCDDYNRYDSTLLINTKTASLNPSTDEEAHDTDISAMEDIESNGETKFLETNICPQPESQISEVTSELNSTDVSEDIIELQKDGETIMHSTFDSHSEKEAFTTTVDNFTSTHLSIYQLYVADSIKYQEEHRSPVSVLEPFFTEDDNSPPSTTLQIAGKQLQPLRLDFGECSVESSPQDQPNSANSCIEDQDHVSQYVHLVLEASRLNWDQLSEMKSLPEELLHASLFNEVEFLPTDYYFDPKLLFDHINKVLLQMYQCHFSSPPWLAFVKPKIRFNAPLAEAVLDEIMTEADFYLLPRTKKRTLNELVSKDIADCRSWLDVRLDTEQIVIETSEDVLVESILDILVDFDTLRLCSD